MKILNRPMFRYGGPIKEGIMDGIRESKRNGGSMSQSVQPSSDGMRPGYKGKSSVLKYIPGFNYLAGQTKGIIPRIINKIKPTFKTQPGKVVGGDASTKAKYMSQTMPKVPFSQRAKAFVTENPYFTGAAAPFALSTASAVAPPVASTIGSVLKSGGLQIADLAVPDFIFDQDKYIKEKKLADQLSNKIEKKTKRTPEQIAEDKIAAAEKSRLSGIAKEEFAEKEKEKRIANYRKIMDIEGMNKDAAYNSLISTSQLINQEGDFKGSIKDGSLINKIIGATSKNFDKPKQTKDAINTLILKNQMAADTPSTALKDLVALGIDTPEKQEMYLRTKMGLPANMGAARAAAQKSGSIGANITKDAAKMMYPGDYKGDILDKETFTERFEVASEANAGRPNEIITSIISQEAELKGYPPGKYTVGDVLVEVDENFNVTIKQ